MCRETSRRRYPTYLQWHKKYPKRETSHYEALACILMYLGILVLSAERGLSPPNGIISMRESISRCCRIAFPFRVLLRCATWAIPLSPCLLRGLAACECTRGRLHGHSQRDMQPICNTTSPWASRLDLPLKRCGRPPTTYYYTSPCTIISLGYGGMEWL